MIWNKIKIIFRDSGLRKKLFFVFLVLVLFRLGANIPIPGVDSRQLSNFLTGNSFFGMMNLFSGGGLSNLSVFMLGVGPFITATIVMQLLTMIFPRLKEIYQEEGEAGRQKFEQYSRILTIPLAFLQGFGLLTLLEHKNVLMNLTFFGHLTNIVIVVAGSMLLMWLGELITEYGVGNGISLLIFAGIIAGAPSALGKFLITFDISLLPSYILILAVSFFILVGVVFVTEAERPIPVSYAKQVRGNKVYGGVSTHLPLRVNQAGVIPLIFAISILLFPQMIAGFLSTSGNFFAQFAVRGLSFFTQQHLFIYGSTYFLLVFFFTYFYTNVTFDPEAISTNLQKSGAFVPGIRPGRSSAEYLSKVLTRITLVGSLFLGAIAVLPMIIEVATGIGFAIGGTALLIVVSVVLETIKEVESQVVMREYE